MRIRQQRLKFSLLVLVFLSIGSAIDCARAKPDMPVSPLEGASTEAIKLGQKLAIHFATHKDFDRLAISGKGKFTFVQISTSIVSLELPVSTTVETVAHCGHRLISLTGKFQTATIHLIAGAKVRTWQDSKAFVVDVFDPIKGASPVAAPNQVAPAKALAQTIFGPSTLAAPLPSHVAEPQAVRVESGKSQSSAVRSVAEHIADAVGSINTGNSVDEPRLSQSLPAMAGTNETQMPPAPASVSILQEADLAGPAILFPVSSKVGGAVFLRGGQIHVVFDQSQAFDLSPLKDDSVFGGLKQAILPAGTVLRFHTRSPVEPHLSQYDGKWALSLASVSPIVSAPVPGRGRAGKLFLDFEMPGRVVVIDDDVTGGRLLIGTDRKGGQRVAGRHISPDLAILSSSQGLVLQPASDRVVLRATREGFEISTPDRSALAAAWPRPAGGAWPDGRLMTRMFDFPDTTADGQARRLAHSLQDAASLPKTARYGARLRVAQAMLAEGLDVEAGAVVDVAVTDDPRYRDDAMAVGLSAIAAWLSGEAGGRQPVLPPGGFGQLKGNDEATMWRALLWPDQPDMARQAAALATTWPLMLRYPQNLRRFMLRPVATLLRAGGQDKAWGAFLASFPDTTLDLSRALYLRSLGKTDESVALLDQVGRRPDRLDRAEARKFAVEERLKAGQLTPAEAAGKLDGLLYAWRGDDRDMRLRQRLAELHAKAGAWRKALMELADAEATFPGEHAAIRQAQANIIDNLLHGSQAAQLGALDLVYLSQQATKLSAEIDQGRFAPLLAEKLIALDLPAEAEPIVRDLFLHAREGLPKAEIGLQLAELQASRGDISAALAVLDASNDLDLTPAVLSSRVLLRARLLALSGKSADALAILASQPGLKAREAEATILEAQRNWQGAAVALGHLANERSFAALPEVSQQEVIVRLARNQSEAGDTAGLRQLRKAYAPRFLSGPNAVLFTVLTAEPVQTTADLPRSGRELEVMHALPMSLSHPAS